MKTIHKNILRRLRAFTLIELLVVISIIAILAALMIPLATNALITQRKNRALTELAQIDTAIDSYKAARGHFPPDNPNNAATNQLFYELAGTVYQDNNSANHTFKRINGSEQISQNNFAVAFQGGNPPVEAFVNTSYVQNWNDRAQLQAAEARDFFSTLKPTQYLLDANGLARLGVPMDGVHEFTNPDGKRLTPWHYNSSNPVYNPESFDLWVDIILKGKTNRICNWSPTPIVL